MVQAEDSVTDGLRHRAHRRCIEGARPLGPNGRATGGAASCRGLARYRGYANSGALQAAHRLALGRAHSLCVWCALLLARSLAPGAARSLYFSRAHSSYHSPTYAPGGARSFHFLDALPDTEQSRILLCALLSRFLLHSLKVLLSLIALRKSAYHGRPGCSASYPQPSLIYCHHSYPQPSLTSWSHSLYPGGPEGSCRGEQGGHSRLHSAQVSLPQATGCGLLLR